MRVPHLRGIIYGRTQKAVLYITKAFPWHYFLNRTHISLPRLVSVQACLSLTWSEISRHICNFFRLVIEYINCLVRVSNSHTSLSYYVLWPREFSLNQVSDKVVMVIC